jgi:hypothetical protein
MDTENILTILSLLGIGTIVGSFFTKRWERSNTVKLQQQNFKFERYKVIILLMYSALDFEKEKDKLKKHGRDFHSIEDLLDELKVEWHNMILFSSDHVLKTMQDFIKSPSQKTFYPAADALRKDLFGSKTLIKFDKMLDFKKVTEQQTKTS